MLYLIGGSLLVMIGVALHRVIIRIVQSLLLWGFAFFLAASALMLDQRLARVETIHAMIAGAIIGFMFVVGVGGVWIRHTLIAFYLRRTIQRDRDAAQAGKLW